MESSIRYPKAIDCRRTLPIHSSKVYHGREISSIKQIAVHHSLTKSGSAAAFARYHVQKHGWPGIGYHYVIEKDGKVKWCNNAELRTYHVGKSNGIAVGVCLVGDFRVQRLEGVQHESLMNLLRFLIRELGLATKDVLGHSEFPDYSWKECPSVDMESIRRSLQNKKPVPQNREFEPFGMPYFREMMLDPNHLLVKPGESVIGAATRSGLFNVGDVGILNKTENLKRPEKTEKAIKIKGPTEILPAKTRVMIEAMEDKGYKVFKSDSKPYNLNIVGIRSNTQQPNSFDDELHVFWRWENRWKHETFTITTDPGLYFLQNPINVSGTAILKENQYRSAYRLGKHRGSYKALVQAKPVTVIRDFDRDDRLDIKGGKEATGFFGINIHRSSKSGRSTRVDKWSAGCQVFADINEYNRFMRLCSLAAAEWGNYFTYTLLNEMDK